MHRDLSERRNDTDVVRIRIELHLMSFLVISIVFVCILFWLLIFLIRWSYLSCLRLLSCPTRLLLSKYRSKTSHLMVVFNMDDFKSSRNYSVKLENRSQEWQKYLRKRVLLNTQWSNCTGLKVFLASLSTLFILNGSFVLSQVYVVSYLNIFCCSTLLFSILSWDWSDISIGLMHDATMLLNFYLDINFITGWDQVAIWTIKSDCKNYFTYHSGL